MPTKDLRDLLNETAYVGRHDPTRALVEDEREWTATMLSAAESGEIEAAQVGQTLEFLLRATRGFTQRSVLINKSFGLASYQTGVGPSNLHRAARLIAEQRPHVERPPADIPPLTGNPVSDVRTVCGFTTEELRELFDVDTETIEGWRDDPESIPEPLLRGLQAILSVGAMIVGGLGPRGVARWFLMGPHPPVELLRDGRLDELVERAEAYQD